MTFYRRNLPHWHPDGKAIFITWRLFGSLPEGMRKRASNEAAGDTATPGGAGGPQPQAVPASAQLMAVPASAQVKPAHSGTGRSARVTAHSGRAFRQMDAELDRANYGPAWLRDPQIALCVVAAIHRGESLGHYLLDTYVIMSNHVHVLLWPRIAMARITGGIKGVSARAANAALGRVGRHFWEDESFDHWVRNETELRRIRTYIERNPVTAGLVETPEEWPWSSASKKTL